MYNLFDKVSIDSVWLIAFIKEMVYTINCDTFLIPHFNLLCKPNFLPLDSFFLRGLALLEASYLIGDRTSSMGEFWSQWRLHTFPFKTLEQLRMPSHSVLCFMHILKKRCIILLHLKTFYYLFNILFKPFITIFNLSFATFELIWIALSLSNVCLLISYNPS